MKITDYGFWFQEFRDLIWTKTPFAGNVTYSTFHYNGIEIGWVSIDDQVFLDLDLLWEAGLKISNVPMNKNSTGQACFPKGYIPSESDFEDLP